MKDLQSGAEVLADKLLGREQLVGANQKQPFNEAVRHNISSLRGARAC